MTLKEFALQVHHDYPRRKRVYIAIMPSDHGYELDVEVIPTDVIGGSYATNTKNLRTARRMADQLESELFALGKTVVKTRQAWESESMG